MQLGAGADIREANASTAGETKFLLINEKVHDECYLQTESSYFNHLSVSTTFLMISATLRSKTVILDDLVMEFEVKVHTHG